MKVSTTRRATAATRPTATTAVCAGHVCSNTWNLVQDSVNQWVADQKAAGRTKASIKKELATFDPWDRYD